MHCDAIEALPLKQLWPVQLSQVQDLPQHSMVRVSLRSAFMAEQCPVML